MFWKRGFPKFFLPILVFLNASWVKQLLLFWWWFFYFLHFSCINWNSFVITSCPFFPPLVYWIIYLYHYGFKNNFILWVTVQHCCRLSYGSNFASCNKWNLCLVGSYVIISVSLSFISFSFIVFCLLLLLFLLFFYL